MRNKILLCLIIISLLFASSLCPAKMKRTTPSESQNAGIGISVFIVNGIPTIVYVKPNSPAEVEGIKIGDQIVEVNGISTQNVDTRQFANLMRGEPETTINLTIKSHQQLKEVSIERYLYSFTREEKQIIQANMLNIAQDNLSKITQREFNSSYNDVWRAAILCLASSDYPLQISDKDSGLIQTQISYVTRGFGGMKRSPVMPYTKDLPISDYVSRIAFEKSGVFNWYRAKEYLTVMVLSTEENKTLVQVKFNIEAWSALYGWKELLSKGTLEQEILDSIGSNL
jgi:membrane-associated protease RseP (regulator of RpoE activity)